MDETKIGHYTYDPESKIWEVRMDKEAWFSCKIQFQAEILSHLVRIERSLNKLLKMTVKKS